VLLGAAGFGPGNSGVLWSGIACALAAAIALRESRRYGGPSVVRLVGAPAGRDHVLDNDEGRTRRPRAALARLLRRHLRRPAPGEVVSLHAARAVHVSATRIVLQSGGVSVVVWRDATDRVTFRRLAAWARWSAGAA
jgi:hypothetical protein